MTSDRIRYVRSLLTPKNQKKLQRSSLSVRVMARLIQKKQGLKPYRTVTRVTRAKALAEEKAQIERLIRQGYLLTNWQHNPHRHLDAKRAVRAILTNYRTAP